MNWGWLLFAAFVEAIVTYVALHWESDWKPIVTLFGVVSALPFVLIILVAYFRMEANPANAAAVGNDAITATVNAFVDALPSAIAGEFAGAVVGGVLGLITRK